MRAQEFITEKPELLIPRQGVAEGLTEIENMPANQFVGGKDMLDTRKRPAKQNLQPLLGGTDLLYAVDQDRHGPRVVIVEPGVSTVNKPQVVAALYLDPVDYLPNTVQVASITVDEDYRGRGLAKALYDIVFTKMRKNLLSGDEQTPGGKRNWMSLASIPGVEVKGMVRIPNDIFDLNKNRVSSNYQKYIDQTMDQIMELGGQFFHKNKDFSFWLFDVVPGKGQLQPYVQNSLSKLYGYDARNLLLATWNRGINESQQGVAEDAMRDVIYTKPDLEHEWPEANRYPEFHKLGKDQWIKIARQGSMAKWSSLKDVGNFDSDLSNLEPEKRKRAAVLVNRGKVELPIVGRWPNGELDLIAGNTRIATLLDQGHDPKVWVVDVPDVDIKENFADGKVKGKSRPGRVKRSGASCNGSVTDLRRRAKNASGEKAKMYHWCANMKSGKKK